MHVGFLYSVTILLNIGFDGVVCYEIRKHANGVVFCIDIFPFRMNVTYFQCVYINSSISSSWYDCQASMKHKKDLLFVVVRTVKVYYVVK